LPLCDAFEVFEVFDDPAVGVVDGVESVLLEDEALDTWNGAKRMGGKDMVTSELF
jgi:hypothetical protein